MPDREEESAELPDGIYSPDLDIKALFYVKCVACCCILVGILALISVVASFFFQDPEGLTTYRTIRSLTALGFALSGTSLLLLQYPNHPCKLIIGKILALLISLMGLMVFSYYLERKDYLIFHEYFDNFYLVTKGIQPQLMSQFSAINFMLLGIALFFLQSPNPRLYQATQALIFIISSLSIITAFVQAYTLLAELGLGERDIPSFVTILLFGLLSTGLYASRPREGVISLLTNNTMGGYIGRRLIAFPFVFPFIVSLFQIFGINSFYLSSRTAYALSLFFNLLILNLLILWFAKIMLKSDHQRRRLEEAQTVLSKRLAISNKNLEDFANTVSHDLKDPLRGICTLAGWLKADYSEKIDDEGKKQLTLLVDSAKQMNTLINKILEYSHLGSLGEPLTLVNMNDLVNEVFQLFSMNKHITFIITSPLPTILCPPIQMKQVLQNLIGNSVKSIDKPAGIISINAIEKNDHWEFSVKDNGSGIESKYFEKIFQLFHSPIHKSNIDSTGIGLYLLKKTVELWGGKVWVESKFTEGSTFFFTYPKDVK